MKHNLILILLLSILYSCKDDNPAPESYVEVNGKRYTMYQCPYVPPGLYTYTQNKNNPHFFSDTGVRFMGWFNPNPTKTDTCFLAHVPRGRMYCDMSLYLKEGLFEIDANNSPIFYTLIELNNYKIWRIPKISIVAGFDTSLKKTLSGQLVLTE